MNVIIGWFKRNFSDPQVVILTIFLIGGIAVVLLFGNMLAPLIASIIIAYLLEGLVKRLQRLGTRRMFAVVVVFSAFVALLLYVILGLLPVLSQQISELVKQLQNMTGKGQDLLLRLPYRYPDFITQQQITDVMAGLKKELSAMGQHVLSLSLSSVVGLITAGIYLVLVPMLVFFLLKDKDKIFSWMGTFTPKAMGLTSEVWHDVDHQIGNYVRGKVLEIFIVWVATFVTFYFMKMPFAMLLGFLVGLSVVVPYIGAVVVTIPVVLIAYFHWGWSPELAYLLTAYLIIQAIDGSVIVPLLFSEVVNLHPIAIIAAILVFGGLWGFWGVFFAIPLASVVKAVLKARPRTVVEEPPSGVIT